MRRSALLAVVLGGLILGAVPPGPPISGASPVIPDREERAAFQRQELARKAKLLEALERSAQTSTRESLQRQYDVLYYRLALDFRDLPAQNLYGRVSSKLLVKDAEFDTILFDFIEVLEVDSVLVNGRKARFNLENEVIWIRPYDAMPQGSVVETEIVYHGRPPTGSGLGSMGFYERENGKPLVWTLSEPIGAHLWWPCKDRPDDKADSIDVLIRSPGDLTFTSNGLLADTVTNPDHTKTFHWRHRYPIATYLVSVTGTDYQRIEDEYVDRDGNRMLVEHFVYPERSSFAEEDLSITPAAIGVLAGLFGPYPFSDEKYGHTIFPWGGAMEHQTNTSYGAGLITGGHHYDYILVHELAHQWWGDMTSPADWKDIWLNEGFASYGEALWVEHEGGFEDYRQYMVEALEVFDPSGPLYDPLVLFDGNTVYNKGAWAVHMLRGVLGDSLFYASLNEYRARTAYRSTTTAEFQSVVEDVASRDMDWFFDSWVYGVDRPDYAVSFLPTGTPELPGVAVHVDQSQTQTGFFPMPLELRIDLVGGGSVTKKFWHDPTHLDLEMDLPAAPSRVVVDPHDWILKNVRTEKYTFHITTTDLPAVEAGEAVSARILTRGGDLPLTYRVIGSLPAGLALDTATGRLSGSVADTGAYSFTIGVRDRRNQNDLQDFRLLVGKTVVDPGGGPTGEGPLALSIGPQPAAWTTFSMQAPRGSEVRLRLYDVAGRRVRELWNGAVPGRAISWDGRDDGGARMPSGFYFARLEGADGTVTRRFVLLR